jgi:glycosyltransferase involved in cell wall biosynthesis
VKQLKILFVTSSLSAGGAERVASTLCNAWVSRGDSVTLVQTYSKGGESFYKLDSRVDFQCISTIVGLKSYKGRGYIKRLYALRKLIIDRKPDVVISFMSHVNVATLLAIACTRVPCIICERTDPTMEPIGQFWRNACKLLYRYADVVAVQTKVVAIKIKRIYGGLKRVEVLPNPFPIIDYVHPFVFTEKDRRVLLSMGRLSEEKRVSCIIDSFAEVADRFPNWELHIYGDGALRKHLIDQIESLGLQSRILMMGQTNAPWTVMSNADAFVIASRFEGFPNTLLEAMGIGLACISTDCPSGPRDITRDGIDARLVAVDDFLDMQAAMAEFMGDDELRLDYGRRARCSILGRYSLDLVLSRWDSVFRSIGAM